MKLKFLFFALVFIELILTGCEQQPSSPLSPDMDATGSISKIGAKHSHGDKMLTVMTRNMYVGGNVDKILTASDPNEIPLLVLDVFNEILSTQIEFRVQLLADEIAAYDPHMVGLQEVSLIRYQSPGDFLTGSNTPAADVLFDYLALLTNALEQRGLHYRVAGKVQNVDVELPMVVDPAPLFDDVRLTDFDVVLVRRDLKTFRVKTGNFKAMFEVPVDENVTIEIKRGYVIVDVKFHEQKYRFVNTHLEDPSLNPELEYLQLAQAQELVKMVSNQAHPVIMVGDFNSVAPDGMTYQYLLSEKFTDVWMVNTITDDPAGYTYGHDYDLRNPGDFFTERIDYVFIRNKVRPYYLGPVSAWVIGDELAVFNTYNLWPSDHGGVVADFQMPKWKKRMAFH